MKPPITVRVGEEEMHEDRYSRFRLIPWWDQNEIAGDSSAGDWRRSAGQ